MVYFTDTDIYKTREIIEQMVEKEKAELAKENKSGCWLVGIIDSGGKFEVRFREHGAIALIHPNTTHLYPDSKTIIDVHPEAPLCRINFFKNLPINFLHELDTNKYDELIKKESEKDNKKNVQNACV